MSHLSESAELCCHYMQLFIRTSIRTLQQVLEEVVYFSSSCNAIKLLCLGSWDNQQGGNFSLQISHLVSVTLTTSVQHTAFALVDIQTACELQTCKWPFPAPVWSCTPSGSSHIILAGGSSCMAGPRRQTLLITLNESWVGVFTELVGTGHKIEIIRQTGGTELI